LTEVKRPRGGGGKRGDAPFIRRQDGRREKPREENQASVGEGKGPYYLPKENISRPWFPEGVALREGRCYPLRFDNVMGVLV
jgi:hypothetical protein